MDDGGDPAGDDRDRAAGEGPRPLRRDAARNRRRILDAAAVVLAEKGHAATFDEIAERAGVGVATVYRRFATKAGLVDALFERQVAEHRRIIDEALEVADPWDGFVHYVVGVMDGHATSRALNEIFLGAGTSESDAVERGRAEMQPRIDRLVRRARDAGALRDDVTAIDVPILLFMVGMLCDRLRYVAGDAWRRALVVVLDGLRADPSGPSPMPVPSLDATDLIGAMARWRPER
ncbi:MAG: TetR/AcrR family transcriptional regulator [Solirubrobacteraceae bacterium]|nr:TetR/AcrR family transcriptional regulator [Solirubrobacteraceae bacterium]